MSEGDEKGATEGDAARISSEMRALQCRCQRHTRSRTASRTVLSMASWGCTRHGLRRGALGLGGEAHERLGRIGRVSEACDVVIYGREANDPMEPAEGNVGRSEIVAEVVNASLETFQ